jgi:hypothetical protein
MTELTDRSALVRLTDQQEIRDCLSRYCRGIDRRDRALLESVYWPDATDDHVSYVGLAPGFIDWVLPLLENMELTQHLLGQTLIQLDGEAAAAETYFSAYHRMLVAGELCNVWFGGRYVDRFEKRVGNWRLAHRRVVGDWHRSEAAPANGWDSFSMGPFPLRNTGTGNDADPSIALLKGNWF